MTFYEKFLDECTKTGLAPSAAMEEMGLNKSTLTAWKKGKSVPSDYVMGVVAKFFGCPLDEFAAARSETVALRQPEGRKRRGPSMLDDPKRVPLVGTIACGSPITAYENVEELIPTLPKIRADFALRCRGDSMIGANIFDGSIVYIREQPVVENGQIAAVMIDDEATLKTVYYFPDHIRLVPENNTMRAMDYYGEETEHVKILGKAVAVTNFLNGEKY